MNDSAPRTGLSRHDREPRGGKRRRGGGSAHYRDEVFSKRVPAGRRTYFFDVKPTRSGTDFFIVVTESKRVDDNRYEKHKIFLYKEDFAKFIRGLSETIQHVREEFLPDFEFHGLPDLNFLSSPDRDR